MALYRTGASDPACAEAAVMSIPAATAIEKIAECNFIRPALRLSCCGERTANGTKVLEPLKL
jgi:hypothetical protein